MNWKVLLGIGAVILLAYLFMPQIASYSWILVVLICPLSMVFMMASMNHKDDKSVKMFVCPECGYMYREQNLADKCEAWCKEHNSCNLEITKHGIPPK